MNNKKYFRSPIGYVGTKYEQLSYIEPLLDRSKIKLIDLFAGSGVFYLNMLKHYQIIYANDILEPIIGLHKAILENPEEFKRKVRNISSSELQNKDQFQIVMDAYKYHPTYERLFCLIQLSIRYSLELTYEGEFNMRFNQRRVYNNFEEKVDEFVRAIKEGNQEIIYSSVSFDQFEVPDNSMFFCDPPYLHSSTGYCSLWNEEMDLKLYDYLKKIDSSGNSFLLTGTLQHGGIPNHLLRKLIVKDGYHMRYLPHSMKKHKEGTIEIMIMNYIPSKE